MTWGVGSVMLSPTLCPSICKSMTSTTQRMNEEEISGVIFDYTGIYISETSVLAPVLWTARVLDGLLVDSDEASATSLCPAVCSTDLSKAVAVAGCTTALTGALDNTFVVDYVTANMVCPVSASFS